MIASLISMVRRLWPRERMVLARVGYRVHCAPSGWEVVSENNNVSVSCSCVFGYGQLDSEKLGVCGCIFACRSFDGGDLAYPTQHAATPWTVGRLRPWRMRPVTCSRLISVVQGSDLTG